MSPQTEEDLPHHGDEEHHDPRTRRYSNSLCSGPGRSKSGPPAQEEQPEGEEFEQFGTTSWRSPAPFDTSPVAVGAA